MLVQRNENSMTMVQQTRQLHLTTMREGKRMMTEWQAEGYEKHALNMQRRRETEQAKLRFELSLRNKRVNAQTAANAMSAADLSAGVEVPRPLGAQPASSSTCL